MGFAKGAVVAVMIAVGAVATAAACVDKAPPAASYGPPPVYLMPGPGYAPGTPTTYAPAYGTGYVAPGTVSPPPSWAPPPQALPQGAPPSSSGTSDPLYDALMRYRAAAGLPPIPRSPSLNRVAQTHVADLEAHPPDMTTCNLHSWSNAGPWTPCCYTADAAQAKCMWTKPKELSHYPNYGFEVAVYTTGTMTPDVAIKSWDGSSAHKPVILNQGQWSQTWNAVGTAVSQHYAVAWFGWDADPGP